MGGHSGTRQATTVVAPLLLLATIALLPSPARAAFHVMKVREVYAGSPDRPNAHFVELQMYAAGQNQVGGHEVAVYSATGVKAASFVFPAAVPKGDNQSSILVATTDAQSYFGITPDLLMTPSIPRAAGKVCFDAIDCVSWGNYTGSSAGTGTPFNAAEGLVSGAGLDRNITGGLNPGALDGNDDTGDSATDFVFAEPSPRNNAGTTGTACCAVGFQVANYSVEEAGGPAEITVARNTGAGALTVSYATVNGTASGSDYTTTSGTLSFAAGQTSRTFPVPVTNDAIDEYDETVILRVRDPSVGVLSRPNATLTIEGNLTPGPPGAPKNLTATPASGQITLNWTTPALDGGSAITAYKVYGGTSPGSRTLVATLAGNVLTYTDGGLPTGYTKYYVVSALNASGEGPFSNEASATTPGTADTTPPSVTMSTQTGTVIVFGQPPVRGGAADNVAVGSVRVDLYTLAGQPVKTIMATCTPPCPSPSVQWLATISGLLPGPYFLRATSSDTSFNNSLPASIYIVYAS